MPPKAKAASGPLILERLHDERLTVPIVGVTPVIPHKWSEKALRMMRDKQFGATARQKKPPKDPQEEAESATYWIDKEHTRAGMPATGFKAAMVAACRFFDAPSMTEARLLLFVEGVTAEESTDQLVEIIGEKTLREDTPRNATGVADLRYRYAWFPWRATLTIKYPAKLLAPQAVLALVDAAGRVGVGDWRPGSPKSSTGVFGTFRVDDEYVDE